MPPYVVDASVAAKWFFEEEHAPRARLLLATGQPLHVPEFIHVELTNVAWRKALRGQFPPGLVVAFPERIRDLPLIAHEDSQLLPAAMTIALDHHRSVYDSLYLALALRENCRLVTADRRFYNALRGHFGDALLWVEDLDSNGLHAPAPARP